jgi:hypothetical protein
VILKIFTTIFFFEQGLLKSSGLTFSGRLDRKKGWKIAAVLSTWESGVRIIIKRTRGLKWFGKESGEVKLCAALHST